VKDTSGGVTVVFVNGMSFACSPPDAELPPALKAAVRNAHVARTGSAGTKAGKLCELRLLRTEPYGIPAISRADRESVAVGIDMSQVRDMARQCPGEPQCRHGTATMWWSDGRTGKVAREHRQTSRFMEQCSQDSDGGPASAEP
jgi:hypothetical protein